MLILSEMELIRCVNLSRLCQASIKRWSLNIILLQQLDPVVTPAYKRPILGTEKHMAEIIYNLELVFKERDFRLLN